MPDSPEPIGEVERVDGYRIERTGEFLTDEEWADLQRPVSRLWDLGVTGEQQWPAKLGRMARDHGLEPRDDGHTRWAVDRDTRELCYAVPADV
jgi:hypothetical protein